MSSAAEEPAEVGPATAAVHEEPTPPPPRGGNLAALGLIQVFRVASSTGLNLVLMRWLGVEGFGVYGYVTTLVGLASFGAGMGMDRLLKREIARDPASAGHRLATALAASLLLSLGTGAGILAWVGLVDGRPAVFVAALLATLALALQTFAAVPIAYFHAIRHMGLGVSGSLVGRLALLLATAAAGALGLGVTGVFAAQVLEAALTFVLVWRAFRGLGVVLRRTSPRDVHALVRDAVPFGLNTLFGGIYLGVDVLLLAWIRGDVEVGVYRGAVMLLALFPILADTFTAALYPRMSCHLGRPALAGEELRFAARLLLVVSVPAALGGMLCAEPLLVFLGGPAFAASALPFVVLAPVLPVRFLNNGLGMALSALDRQESRTRGVFFAALFNIGANLVVLPRYGAVGAAATTVLTEALLLAWNTRAVAALVDGLGLGETLARICVPAVLMAAAIRLLPATHVLVPIVLGAAVYAAGAVSTGALRRGDVHHLRRV